MTIKFKSGFKTPEKDLAAFNEWVAKMEALNGRNYERITVSTSLGKTHVWGLNTANEQLETLVIFPGARTSALFWDFDRGLDNLDQELRIFMVETNGLPNLSDGATPDIRSLDYGHWASAVMDQLGIERTFVAGASFGGLICMKLAITNPEKIKAAFLLNPGCLQPFSMTPKNLYYNLLPIFSPKPQNVKTFLDKAIFCKPHHEVSPKAEQLLIDYEFLALSRYQDKTQKPYFMGKELEQVKSDTYLLVGDKDLLFPFRRSVENARRLITGLKEVEVYQDVAHGIETYENAMNYIGKKIAWIHRNG